MNERSQREANFHDHKYSAGQAPLTKYYGVLESVHASYLDEVTCRAPGNKVLEYGCGKGSSALGLAAIGGEVTGIDISETGVMHAREEAESRGLKADFRVMDAEHLEFDDDYFDLICGTAILHHLDIKIAMSEISRTLKPDGSAIFVEPLGHNPAINLVRKLTPKLRTPDEHPLLLDDLELMKGFFDEMKVTYGGLLTLLALPFRKRSFFQDLVRYLHSMEAALFRRLPFCRRFAWVAMLDMKHPSRSLRRNTSQ